jgi:hypothetical protein
MIFAVSDPSPTIALAPNKPQTAMHSTSSIGVLSGFPPYLATRFPSPAPTTNSDPGRGGQRWETLTVQCSLFKKLMDAHYYTATVDHPTIPGTNVIRSSSLRQVIDLPRDSTT